MTIAELRVAGLDQRSRGTGTALDGATGLRIQNNLQPSDLPDTGAHLLGIEADEAIGIDLQGIRPNQESRKSEFARLIRTCGPHRRSILRGEDDKCADHRTMRFVQHPTSNFRGALRPAWGCAQS